MYFLRASVCRIRLHHHCYNELEVMINPPTLAHSSLAGPILRTGLVNTGLVLSIVTRIDNLPIFETEFGQIGVGRRPGPSED